MTAKEKLVGQVLTGFDISQDRQSITFHTVRGLVTLTTFADCCSYTWIESLDAPYNLKGRVLFVEERDMPKGDNVKSTFREDCDVVVCYGLMIITENGHCLIDYRNDSNGYYGGGLD